MLPFCLPRKVRLAQGFFCIFKFWGLQSLMLSLFHDYCMKIKKIFLLGAALCLGNGSYCASAALDYKQIVPAVAAQVASAVIIGAMECAVLIGVGEHSDAETFPRFCNMCAGSALGVCCGRLFPEYRTHCACWGGIIGATIGSLVERSAFGGCGINIIFGSLSLIASEITGVNAIAAAIVGRILVDQRNLMGGAVAYAIMYYILNYFLAERLGLWTVAIATTAGAAVWGGLARYNQNRRVVLPRTE
jgi:hypothetical protein